MRQAALVILASLGILSGCITAPTEEQVEAAQAEILEQFEASQILPTTVTKDGWYILPVASSPEGGLAAFEWTVPTGALVPWGYNEVFEEDRETLALEVALVGGGDADAWGLVALDDDDAGKLGGIGGTMQIVESYTIYSAMSEDADTSEVYPVTFANIGFEVEEGELLRLLAFARGPVQEVGIAFRILDHDPWYPDSDEEPADSADDFLAARGATTPFGLMPRATGNGFAVNGYFDILFGGMLPTDSSWGVEAIVGAPSVEWSAPPKERAAGGAHTLTASVTGVMPHGFDAVGADYFSAGAYERSTFALEAVLHDEVAQAEGSVGALGPLPIFLPVGSSYAGGYAGGLGDGDGESSAALSMDRTRYGGYISAASVSAFEFGATLDELFGVPAASDMGAFSEGSGFPFPPVWIVSHGALTQVRADGSAWTWPLPRDVALPTGTYLGR